MNPKATMSRTDIIDYAARYVDPKDVIDFPFNNDLFCLLGRKVGTEPLPDDEGWEFNGYGVCTGYVLDDLEMPVGKWIWMYFAALSTFPPQQQVLKLQPPHIVKGGFQNPERTYEFKFIKVRLNGEQAENSIPAEEQPAKANNSAQENTPQKADNIVPFRRKK